MVDAPMVEGNDSIACGHPFFIWFACFAVLNDLTRGDLQLPFYRGDNIAFPHTRLVPPSTIHSPTTTTTTTTQ